MKIYIDESLPESCASCQFLVRCCECEGYENICPFIGDVGYDPSDDLKEGAPVIPTVERHEDCPLEERPHGEKKCPICGSDLYEYCFMCCYEGEKVTKNGKNPYADSLLEKEGEKNESDHL